MVSPKPQKCSEIPKEKNLQEKKSIDSSQYYGKHSGTTVTSWSAVNWTCMFNRVSLKYSILICCCCCCCWIELIDDMRKLVRYHIIIQLLTSLEKLKVVAKLGMVSFRAAIGWSWVEAAFSRQDLNSPV